MYFKILPIQKDKYTAMGMINVDAELYLEKGDEGYEKYIAEHYVTVPVIPEGGYPRQKELDAEIVTSREGKTVMESFETYEKGKEQIAYEKWVSELPTIQQLNPFCNHSIQFEHDATEEEILWCFEFALGITHRNYLIDDLHCKKGGQIVHQPFHYSARREYYKVISQLPLVNRSDYMNSELAKVSKAEARLGKIKNTDFTKVKTIGKYKVR